MHRAVIVGGFTTGNRLLEPVADAICQRFGFTDADIFRFTDAIARPDKVSRALARQAAFVHSAGLVAIANCTGMNRVAALNSPEPSTTFDLAASAANKTARLYASVLVGPDRRNSTRVLASNTVQTALHPLAHAKQIRTVGRFSTTTQLALMEEGGIGTARFDTVDDEFFGPYPFQEWDGKRAVLPGRHDQVLLDPYGFIGALPQEAIC